MKLKEDKGTTQDGELKSDRANLLETDRRAFLKIAQKGGETPKWPVH